MKSAIRSVALLNFSYFWVEILVALAIGSVALFADSIDFLEDSAVNLLILIALGWSAARRAQVGFVLGAILLVPTLATLWAAWGQLASPVPPEPFALTLTGLGALCVNMVCAFLLVRHRNNSGSLTRAAWLSARNDAFANIAIIGAGLITTVWLTIWPDLIVGIAIAALNMGAAREVWQAARQEHYDARP